MRRRPCRTPLPVCASRTLRSGRQSYSTRGVREPGANPGLTRSGEGDGRGTRLSPESSSHWGLALGRRSAPDDPESEDLLVLAATAARSHAGPAHGPLTRRGTHVDPDPIRPMPRRAASLAR